MLVIEAVKCVFVCVRLFFLMLLFQMTSLTKEPKLFVVAGCLRGLTALMVNFTKTMDEGGMLFVCVCL